MPNNIPALLGGRPKFENRVPIVHPLLPKFTELAGGIQEILDSRMVTKGQYLEAFEAAVREHLGVRHAIGVSSCTSGLMLTYKCLGLKGEVVVPSFTFMATVSALTWCGLRPVYADVRRDTTNLDPVAAEAAITPQTTAIVAVHNFGNPADIEGLQQVTDRHGLKLIFDAAHGFGALYRGKPVGGQGNAQIFSLSPTKLLIAGEGGLVATNDDELAEKIRIGREYGNNGSYDSIFPGLNARLAEFNALMGFYSLKELEQAAQNRNHSVDIYTEELGCLPGIGFQRVDPGDRNSYKDFSITIDEQLFGLNRDELAQALNAENIDTRKYYEPPVHRQSAYRYYYSDQPLSNTDWLSLHSLSLPIWSEMSVETAAGICAAIRCAYEYRDDIHHKLKTS
jgi:dTDP-4-amino-4,6-dideoxygalactose transaminase